MCSLVFLQSADSSLGRLDYASLSQEALMEMLIEGIENKEKICGDASEMREVNEWNGVELEMEKFHTIHWDNYGLEGSLHWEWTPSTLTVFSVCKNKLVSTIDLSILPASVRHLSLNYNRFNGSICLKDLPKEIDSVNLSLNQLIGSLDLRDLPASLKNLLAFSNKFTGGIDLTRLPAELTKLDLSYNALSGTVELGDLPKGLKYMRIDNNNFSGPLNLTSLPDGMVELHVNRNSFSGPVDFMHLPDEMRFIDLRSNQLCGEATIPRKSRTTVCIARNDLTLQKVEKL
ncbi:leucine-rich repeat protein [Perkinsela sp. CCAP 1560/4]|nr:leucine-rich repeat protein [Perkinsela sp. CCAP 1560/4]|eukprot:KNH04475.1 leucine-rich repeat protein [Perkinsela sp. CCAP 1560/4]